jgi:hypothetical protein
MRVKKIVDSRGDTYFQLILSGEEMRSLRLLMGMNTSIPNIARSASNRGALTIWMNGFNIVVDRVFTAEDRARFPSAFDFDGVG